MTISVDGQPIHGLAILLYVDPHGRTRLVTQNVPDQEVAALRQGLAPVGPLLAQIAAGSPAAAEG